MYQGLKHENYYWELINTTRKLILLALNVFVPDSLNIVKALVGVFTLFIISLIQGRIRPFKIDVITNLGKYLNYVTLIFLILHRK